LAQRLHEENIEIEQPRVEGVPLTPSSQITVDGETASPGTLVSYSLSPPGHHTRALQSSLRSVVAGSEPAVLIPPSPAIPPSPQAQFQHRKSSYPVMPTRVTKTGKVKAASTSTASATASKMTEKTDIDDLINSTQSMNLTADADGCPMPILRGKFYEIIHMKTSKKSSKWKRKTYKKAYEVLRILVHPCVSEKQVKFEWVDQYTLKIMLVYPTWFYDFDKHYSLQVKGTKALFQFNENHDLFFNMVSCCVLF
jgi:hypothetical protein